MSLLRRFAARFYALALWAFPAEHRALYRGEMVADFEREIVARRHGSGATAALGFLLVASLDALAAGFEERRRIRRRRRSRISGRTFAGFARDLRYAVRALAQARSFSVVCVLSLGLGLGVVFAMSMFLRQLTATPPHVDTEGLVEIVGLPQGPLRARVSGGSIATWSYPDFQSLGDADTGMALTGWASGDGILAGRSLAPQRTSAMYVSANYFTAAGVGPEHGRVFTADDEGGPDAQPVAVVSHDLWQNRLGGAPDIVGSTVDFNRVEHIVVGVAPEGFRGHMNRRAARRADIWLPLREHPVLARSGLGEERGADWIRLFGRLAPGVELADANSAVVSVMAGLAEQHPESNEHRSALVAAYSAVGVSEALGMRLISAMFLAMAGLVLIVVCLNVLGMMLVRGATRSRELAIRQALGASRGRLVSCLMAEAAVLASVAGVLSVAVVYGGAEMIAWWLEIPIQEALRLTPARALTCVGMAFAASVVFGLIPSIRCSRSWAIAALKDDSGAGGWRVGRLHRLSAALQVGIALPFLALGALIFAGARTTATADLGFVPEGLFAAELSLEGAGYSDDEATPFVRLIQDRLLGVDGVTAVAVADGLPLDYEYRRIRVSRAGDEARMSVQMTRVGAGYLAAIGTPVRRGRGITEEDIDGSELVAVISEPLATRLFPAGSAIGGIIESPMGGKQRLQLTVVGISADVATSQLQTERPQIFVPLAQHPAQRLFVVARAAAGHVSMKTAFEESMADFESELGRPTLVTGTELVRDGIGDLLQQSSLSMLVALVALTLSALGIYGVVAFMVASRTREIGVRIALGATRRRVLNGVLRDTLVLCIPGLIVGVLLARFAVRQTGLLWYDLSTMEPIAYATALAVVLVVALLASLPPARRAASVEPIDAIRSD